MADSRRITPDELKAMTKAFFSIEVWQHDDQDIFEGRKDGFVFWLARERTGEYIGTAIYNDQVAKQTLDFGKFNPKLAENLYNIVVSKMSRN